MLPFRFLQGHTPAGPWAAIFHAECPTALPLTVFSPASAGNIWITPDLSYKSQTGCSFFAEIFLDLLTPLDTLDFSYLLMRPLWYLFINFLASFTHWIVSPFRAGAVLPSMWPRGRHPVSLCWSRRECTFHQSPRAAVGGSHTLPGPPHHGWFHLQTKSLNPGLFPRDHAFT